MFPTVYFGRHLSIREVWYFPAGRVRVETEHPLDVYADGEYVCRTPVEVGVRRGALKVMFPRVWSGRCDPSLRLKSGSGPDDAMSTGAGVPASSAKLSACLTDAHAPCSGF